MVLINEDFVLECQQCGEVIIHISREDMAGCQKARNAVADNPYNYILYCRECKNDPGIFNN